VEQCHCYKNDLYAVKLLCVEAGLQGFSTFSASVLFIAVFPGKVPGRMCLNVSLFACLFRLFCFIKLGIDVIKNLSEV